MGKTIYLRNRNPKPDGDSSFDFSAALPVIGKTLGWLFLFAALSYNIYSIVQIRRYFDSQFSTLYEQESRTQRKIDSVEEKLDRLLKYVSRPRF